MSCREMRDRLLEADRHELEGGGPSPVAEHIRTCAACRATALRILRAEKDLRTAFSRMAPEPPVRVVRAWTQRPNRRVNTFVRFAAAAALVVLGGLWLRPGANDRSSTRLVTVEPSTPLARGPEVRRASGDYALVQTDNPRITVVWILDPE